MICEFCKEEHDGSYGSGRFCNKLCSTSHSKTFIPSFKTVKCKECKNDMDVKRGIPHSYYICETCRPLFYGTRRLTSERELVDLICIDCKNPFRRYVPIPEKKRYSKNAKCDSCKKESNKQVRLKEQADKSWSECGYAERHRRLIVLQDGKCLECSCSSQWNEKPLKLQLDHIDGNNSNNEKENLRLLCPNCHSQTDTYCVSKSPIRHSDDEYITALIENRYDIQKTLTSLGLSNGGQNIIRARKLLKKLEKDNVGTW